MPKEFSFYFIITLFFGALIWGTLEQGKHLEIGKVIHVVAAEGEEAGSFFSKLGKDLVENSKHPFAVLILQVLCIMITARFFGFLIRRLGQPMVVGEIIAGIVLGPSLLGEVFPHFSLFLFPEASLPKLQVLSQVGLILFMFIIGMELDLSVLKKKARAAVIISHASIIFPFFLGVGLAYFVYEQFAPANIPFVAFALFLGIAMSITAFPVLARIVQERGLTRQPIGSLVITCAAADDITAWCLLAVVIAIAHAGNIVHAFGSILLSLVYVFFMLYVLRPFLARFSEKYDTSESLSKMRVAFIFAILLCSSFVTEIIGIHALFGAFLAGVIISPNKNFRQLLAEKIEDVSLVLFLPLFFVFTGLRTEIGLLNQMSLWGICGTIIGIAIFGKFVGSAVAARFVGQSLKDSLIIGTLMNTRGLMELVVLNIGYDLGILSAEVFTMFVLMALITTFMTGPLLSLIEFIFPAGKKAVHEKGGFKTFISFGRPQSGARLLELANSFNLKNEKDSSLMAAHFSPSTEISLVEAEHNEKEGFIPIQRVAEKLQIPLKTEFRVTDNVEKEIAEVVGENHYDLLLLGSSQRLFNDDKMGGKIKNLIEEVECHVGILIDKGFTKVDRVLMIIEEPGDLFLLEYGKKFLEAKEQNILEFLDDKKVLSQEDLKAFTQKNLGWRVVRREAPESPDGFYAQYDLIVVSLNAWKQFQKQRVFWLSQPVSSFVISR